MKKSLYIFVALVTLVLGGVKVSANTDLIGICKYEFDVSGNKVTHKIGLLYYHNLVSGGEDANGNEVSSLKNTGYGTRWNFEKGFDEKIHAATYQNNKVVGCPNIRICNNQNLSLDVYFNSATVCDEGTTSILASATFVPPQNSNVEVEEDILYCSTHKSVRNKSYQIKVEFFSHAGQKKYKISRYDNPSLAVEGNIDDYLTLDGNTYKIKDDVKNAYFKEGATCNPMYVQVDFSEVYTFQLDKPSAGENGSYGTSDEDDDDGSDEYDDDTEGEEEDLEGIAACAAIGNNSKTGKQIKKIITIMKIAIPLLIIVFSVIDLLKVLISEEDKVFKGTWSNFIKRCIVGVVFFLVPALLKLLFTITEILDIYSINADSIFCYLI